MALLLLLLILLDFTLEVDISTGIVSLVRALDREITPSFTVIIAATDQGPGNNQALVCSVTEGIGYCGMNV